MENASADEVRRAILVRADALATDVEQLAGSVSQARTSIRKAFSLLETIPGTVRAVVNQLLDSSDDATARVRLLTPILRHLIEVSSFVETHLSHVNRRDLSEGLTEHVRHELASLGCAEYEVVVSNGPAKNFVTKYGNFSKALIAPLVPSSENTVDPLLFAFFQVPRMEGTRLSWRPILSGHEVAHIAVTRHSATDVFDLRGKFDYERAGQLDSPGMTAQDLPIRKQSRIFEIALAWLTELLCDAHAIQRFGPSALAAFGEYFYAIGSLDALGTTHPPPELRIRLMATHLGPVTNRRLAAIVEPWTSMVSSPASYSADWAEYLGEFFTAEASSLVTVTASWPGDSYDWSNRTSAVETVTERLIEGVPGQQSVVVNNTSTDCLVADVVNAAWIARVEESSRPIESLAEKAVASLEFLRRWSEFGGEVSEVGSDLPSPALKEEGVLAETSIAARLAESGPSQLIITPLLQAPSGAGVDLRLSNQFIVFRRTSVGSFDPILEDNDPRMLQDFVELSWSEQFVLHPHEMVLGSTLEYIVLPSDLTAQVITRSSYGRLGLLSATAVQVHPYWHGCLTLELVNLGNIPLRLHPGQRIAQLVLSKATGSVDPGIERYMHSTGPQFSRAREDKEVGVLRRFNR